MKIYIIVHKSRKKDMPSLCRVTSVVEVFSDLKLARAYLHRRGLNHSEYIGIVQHEMVVPGSPEANKIMLG